MLPLEEIDNIKQELVNLATNTNSIKPHRIHVDNKFNKIFSLTTEAFEEFKTVAERLDQEQTEVGPITKEILRRNSNEDKEKILEEGQKLRRLELGLLDKIKVDFKSLYIFAKVFLDKYTHLITFLMPEKGVSNNSISDFIKHLFGNDTISNSLLSEFKQNFQENLVTLNDQLTFYRDKFIMHSAPEQTFQKGVIYNERGLFKIDHMSWKVNPRDEKRLRDIIENTKELSFLKKDENIRKLVNEIFRKLPNIQEGATKQDLKDLIRKIGIQSLNPDELLVIITGYTLKSLNFLNQNYKEILGS